ncbi:thymidine kinase [Pseudoalteromonas sp. SSM20]|uniref:thymidine kinase n=1 Tax=unclassified Pseudoalteromonas TaxID=194690 RepID=UPI00237D9F8D|nr:thymidine kinase [Pseudoalteromonas sp. G4]MDE3270599.1 thymidine kinase [Pseudoalteromonas sp. G4]
MAQLYFYYSAMNAGKSTTLLQSAFNYKERGMEPLIYTAAIDTRFGAGKVSSRIGLAADASLFSPESNLIDEIATKHAIKKIDCVLIDEAQFLTKKQVEELCLVVDRLKIPVLCYGLRTDFLGELFVGAQYLLAWADKLIELKTVCHCGRKANMVLRTNEQGVPITQGEQVEIGGNDRYVSVCRKHYFEGLENQLAVPN